MFEMLISITGIGPKLAVSILSGIRVDELKHAIQSANVSRIVAVPGIGRKTAERLLLELKNKVDRIKGEEKEISFNIKNEAVAALTTLGYNSKLAEKTIRDIYNSIPGISLEELIKKALGELNK